MTDTPQGADALDARRYRWLRSCGHKVLDKNESKALMAFRSFVPPEELDAAIDAAIASTEGEKP